MRDLLFLSVMLTMVPLVFRFPMVGVMGWAWTALLTPNDWLFSFMRGVPFNKLFAVVTLISIVLNANQIRLRMNRSLWLMATLVLLATVSAAFGMDQSDISWALYSKFVKIILFGFVIAACVRSRLHVHSLLLAVALGMGFVGVSEGAFYIASAGGHKIVGNPSVGDNNQLGVSLLMVLPIILFLAAQSAERFTKLVGYVAAGLVIAAVVGTASRGALIGLIALAVFRIARGKRKLLGFAAVALVGLVILAAAPEQWFHRMDTISDANQDSSFMGRVIAWKISTAIALDRPIFGGGFHAVQHMFAWSYYGDRIGWLSFIPTVAPDPFPHAAHSIYFETLGDLGFPALGIFLFLLFTIYRNGQKLRVLARQRPELAWADDLAFALQSSVVAYSVAGAAVSVSYIDLFYILVVLSDSARQIVVAQLEGAGARLRRDGALIRGPTGKGALTVAG